MHKSLFSNFIEIEENVKTLYVLAKIDKISQNNNYINLLYRDIIDNEILEVKDLATYEYPKIVLSFFKGEKSIVHHHWYDFSDGKSLVILLWKTFWLILYKIMGGKIVWTVHNKYPHNQRFLKINKVLRIFIAKLSTKIHVHCNSAIEIMSTILNTDKSKFFVVEHPIYEVNIYDKDIARNQLKNKYHIEVHQKNVYLMFGLIAEYKGIDKVAEIFSEIPSSILIIAGKPKIGNEDYYQKIISYSRFDNIYIVDKLIPTNDVDIFFNSCDCVIFNYTDILTSGGIILAQSYNKNIITSSKGCMKDIISSKIKKIKSYKELKKVILSSIYD